MRVKGFVLKENQVNENKIIYFYSQEQGLIPFLAKGVLKPKSKLRALCLPFQYLNLTLVPGHQFYILIGGQIKKVYYSIWSSFFKIISSQKVIKDLEELAGQGKDEGIFELFSQTLEVIDEAADKNLVVLIYAFEIKLLDRAGYRPNFKLFPQIKTREKNIMEILLEEDYKDILKKDFSKKDIIKVGEILEDFINLQK